MYAIAQMVERRVDDLKACESRLLDLAMRRCFVRNDTWKKPISNCGQAIYLLWWPSQTNDCIQNHIKVLRVSSLVGHSRVHGSYTWMNELYDTINPHCTVWAISKILHSHDTYKNTSNCTYSLATQNPTTFMEIGGCKLINHYWR